MFHSSQYLYAGWNETQCKVKGSLGWYFKLKHKPPGSIRDIILFRSWSSWIWSNSSCSLLFWPPPTPVDTMRAVPGAGAALRGFTRWGLKLRRTAFDPCDILSFKTEPHILHVWNPLSPSSTTESKSCPRERRRANVWAGNGLAPVGSLYRKM